MISSFKSKMNTYWSWYQTWKTLPIIPWIKAAELYREGEFSKAAELYRKGLQRHPYHEAGYCARLDLAHCLFKQGQYAEAKDELKSIMNQVPSLREAYVRLARIQMWVGESLEAAWTMRKALREVPHDGEIVALFTTATLEHGAPGYLVKEAEEAFHKLSEAEKANKKMEVAAARLEMLRGDYQKGRSRLASLASGPAAPFEAVVSYGETLLKEGRVAIARQQLRRALMVVPNHPRVLGLFAESYLKSGPYQNADFARQLATSACQNSGWMSPEALHTLAEAYKCLDDRLSALATAVRAKEAGSKLLSGYRNVRDIDALIEVLSTPGSDPSQAS